MESLKSVLMGNIIRRNKTIECHQVYLIQMNRKLFPVKKTMHVRQLHVAL